MVMLLSDMLLVCLALAVSFSLRLGTIYIPDNHSIYLFLLAPVISFPFFYRFGLYNVVIKYIGFKEIWAIMQSVSLYALLWGLIAFVSFGQSVLPRSVIFINWFVVLLFISGSRMLTRWWISAGGSSQHSFKFDLDGRDKVRRNVVIYGAGASGIQLVKALTFSPEYKPVAFIDDNPALANSNISGCSVYQFTYLATLIERYNVKDILLAMPSVARSQRKKIVNLLEPYPVHVHTLPGIDDLAQGKIKIDDIREVEIGDLLGRDVVEPNPRLLNANIENKTVMVTGAGGSIGSELCRQIIRLSPHRLIMLDNSEYALYSIDKELNKYQTSINEGKLISIIPILGSVCDQKRLEQVCTTYKVQTIYHAAAYKHVPMVEKNPEEAIKNNIFGTLRAAIIAEKTGVEAFVLISTDKAVRPTNTMGASKRFAELILQGLSENNGCNTRFCMVRFGNVLGSSGSVIPLFREQIASGGPVTVTDPKIIRYFMTIPEAAQLVIQAGAMCKGGDVFVLDMGEPVNIFELAKKLIHLSGFEVKDEEHPNGDIEIKFTGLRPGEKLYEELLIGHDVTSTDHPLVMRAKEEALAWKDIQKTVDDFENALEESNQELIRELLLRAVKGYKPQCNIEDFLYKHQGGVLKSKVVGIKSENK